MPEQTTTEQSTETTQAAEQTSTEATTTAAETTATTQQTTTNVWDDPAAARAEIEKLRRENGSERINAKQAAAEEARNEILTKLGLVKGDEKADPDALAKDLTTAREQARQTAVDLAVYRAAAAAQANPDALLDSASFLAKVRTLDPTGADFATQVTDAIKAAVTGNPNLKAARAAAASGVELGGGTGEQGQITEQQLKTMTPEQIVAAQAKGLLRNLLG
jgi:hypothetical protein